MKIHIDAITKAMRSLWDFPEDVIMDVGKHFGDLNDTYIYLEMMDSLDVVEPKDAWTEYCIDNDIEHEIDDNPFKSKTKSNTKELRFWNVRNQKTWKGSMYIAAYSRSHASEVILSYTRPELDKSSKDFKNAKKRMNKELRDYGNECWGDAMEKLVPNPKGPGLWADAERVQDSQIIRELI